MDINIDKLFDKKEIVNELKQRYEDGDYRKCENSLFRLILVINSENTGVEHYDHEIKRILFQTNFVKNPMSGKYKKMTMRKF